MKLDITKIIGYIILTPAILSVLLFLAQFFSHTDLLEKFRVSLWIGRIGREGGAGYTSALPLYFGLMAIAGAYLIKDKK